MSFNIYASTIGAFSAKSSASDLASASKDPIFNAIQLRGIDIGDLDDIMPGSILVYDDTTQQCTTEFYCY